MTINEVVERFPPDTLFYHIHEGKNNKWVEEHLVHSYRIDANGEIFLVEVLETEFIEDYKVSECFKTKEEAKKLIPPMSIFTRVSVDAVGREIDFAVLDGDRTENVVFNYPVHVEHCCAIHGCKYRDPRCPVTNGQMLQKYLCEECSNMRNTWTNVFNAYNHIRKVENR